jgi:hypothetical protein
MSYAGKDSRSRRAGSSVGIDSPIAARTRGRSGSRVEHELPIRSRGATRPYWKAPQDGAELDWQHIAIFVAGSLFGAALGAGAALLLAPRNGAETRHNLARRGRHLRARTATAWDDLRHELRYAARTGRRKLGRKFTGALGRRRERHELHNGHLADD